MSSSFRAAGGGTSTGKKRSRLTVALAVSLAALIAAASLCWVSFRSEVNRAIERVSQGSVVVGTRCGPIEYQEVGQGTPLLMIHGSGGGHDQGMDFAGSLAQHGIRVIALSRFGYLRTPMPPDASPQAQADANVCLLDAIGIDKASVMGASAGGPSAMQTAIRHPHRVNALVLVVPIGYKPRTIADTAEPLSARGEQMLMRLIGSDFLFWAATHVARDQVIRYVLATPPEQVAAANAEERARVDSMVDHILPVSLRASGLRDDSVLGRSLGPYALDSIRAPTLIISARDDGFGTYASAKYTADHIAGAKFMGFESGGHVLVGRYGEVITEIANLVTQDAKP